MVAPASPKHFLIEVEDNKAPAAHAPAAPAAHAPAAPAAPKASADRKVSVIK